MTDHVSRAAVIAVPREIPCDQTKPPQWQLGFSRACADIERLLKALPSAAPEPDYEAGANAIKVITLGYDDAWRNAMARAVVNAALRRK